MHLDNREMATSSAFTARFCKVAFASALLFGASGAAIAQNMVIKSTGPSAKSYPVGQKLKTGARVSLKKLDRVTILTKSGTRILKGPGSFSLGRAARRNDGTAQRLASFITNRGSRRPRTGAYRGDGTGPDVAPPKNPNLWFLDARKSGKFCVADPAGLVIWRPDFTGSAEASIVDPNSGAVSHVEWRSGNPLKAWPRATAPLENGAKYRVLGSNNPQSVEVNFVILPKKPADLNEAASALIENGCEGQLDLLAETLDEGSIASNTDDG